MKLAARISVTQLSMLHRREPERQRVHVGHLVADHDDALGQVVGAAVARR